MKLPADRRIYWVIEKFSRSVDHNLTNGSLYEISNEIMVRIKSQSISIPIESATRTMSDLNLVYALYGE